MSKRPDFFLQGSSDQPVSSPGWCAAVMREISRLRIRVTELLQTTNRYQERYREAEEERNRLRLALEQIALRAVVRVGPHGGDTAEQRVKAIYQIADNNIYVDCYCGGLGRTRRSIGHQTGCPEVADA